ncbi:MAG: TrkH family potassium uptake protein [Paracoccaceae bacterium]
MPRRIANQPLFLILAGIGAAAMFVPAFHALANERHHEARAFFYSGLLGLIIVTLISVARATVPRRYREMGNLAALFAAFAFLPLMLAVPFYEALRNTTFLNAYAEMVSALTTTGMPHFEPDRLSGTLHLWRAMVGWMGGLLVWTSAAAILAPLSLGGFEVTATAEPGQGERLSQFSLVDPQTRIIRVGKRLIPIYTGLTAVLWLLLVVLGEDALIAACHAMSTLSTSGISPVGGVQNAHAGLIGEAVIALFLLFALSRLTFSNDTLSTARVGILRDPEFRLGLLIVIGVPLVLFLRHWVGAYEVSSSRSVGEAGAALWGGVFTVLSFLTTTGFESAQWQAARDWSGMPTPGLIFLGLAIIGGGVATTAGGVKLLRVWVLYLNGLREMEKLIHPNSVGHSSGQSRRFRRKGAFVAWVFFMLFAMTLSLLMLTLAALGADFETATVLAIAALSNTGPLVSSAPEFPIILSELGDGSRMVLVAGMVLGRLEMLAIIALLTTETWRD